MNIKNAIKTMFFKDIFGGKHTRKNCLDEAVESVLSNTPSDKQHRHDEKSCINCKFNAERLNDSPDECYDCSEFLLTPYIFSCMGFSFFLCMYLVQKGVI